MSVSWREQTVAFGCSGEQLVGIVSAPAVATAAGDTGLVVVVGGPQVRTGSHRQFTRLCRSAAAAGVPALRFDVRGMGDASGALHAFEEIGDDIAAALDAFCRVQPTLRRVVLWGLCDGASAALMYVHERRDPRVVGLVLLNPWVRSATTLARTHVKHYYLQRLRQGEFWRKLLTGDVAGRAVREFLGNLRAARHNGRELGPQGESALPFQERMLRGAEGFAGRALWVLSGQDYTAKEFVELAAQSPRWQAVLARDGTARLDLAQADHTFSATADERAAAEATIAWLSGLPLPATLQQSAR